jgi:hypothetical protein
MEIPPIKCVLYRTNCFADLQNSPFFLEIPTRGIGEERTMRSNFYSHVRERLAVIGSQVSMRQQILLLDERKLPHEHASNAPVHSAQDLRYVVNESEPIAVKAFQYVVESIIPSHIALHARGGR